MSIGRVMHEMKVSISFSCHITHSIQNMERKLAVEENQTCWKSVWKEYVSQQTR